MSVQTSGTLLVGLGLLLAFLFRCADVEDSTYFLPALMVVGGLLVAVLGRRRSDPI